jgi:hypothetical protein
VRPMVQVKYKVGMLLMEAGVSYNKQKRQKAGYFRGLLGSNPDIDPGRRSLPRPRRFRLYLAYLCVRKGFGSSPAQLIIGVVLEEHRINGEWY